MWSRNLENQEAKARYRAVKIQTQWVVTPGKQTVYAVYGNYSSNRVKWLPSEPTSRSTGLWTERIIKEWTSATKRRRSPCFHGRKRIFKSWRSFWRYTLPERAKCRRNLSKTRGHAGTPNCTICTNRKLKVIVLGTPLCPSIQHCPHTVSRTAFTAQSSLYARCQHNVLTGHLKINEALVRESTK